MADGKFLQEYYILLYRIYFSIKNEQKRLFSAIILSLAEEKKKDTRYTRVYSVLCVRLFLNA